jgi:cobalt-precorrin 5A hydrolase/precorrin-3B C17-methyltransferase
MTELLPDDIAIVVLGPGGAALGRRLKTALPGARLHGPRARPEGWDESYNRAALHIAGLFEAGRPILGLCASGILIRSVAPLLVAKRAEPPVVAVAEDGSVAVPLIGGHRGANALARAVAELTGGVAAITTAGDVRLGLALDEPPPGWRIADPERVMPVAAALLRGEPVALVEEAAGAEWLRAGAIRWAKDGKERVLVTDRAVMPGADALVFHPPVLALGIGCERGCSAQEIADLARSALAEAGLAAGAVAAVVSLELKRAEAGIHALAAELGVPARFLPVSRLLAETERLTERSAAVFRATGCWGVAEGAALAAAGPDGVLVVPKHKSRRATCAVARAADPIAADAIGRQRGRLAVIGIGPGDPAWRTPEASAALAHASDVVGYGLYLDLLGRAIAGKNRYMSALGEEEARVRQAFDLAAEGRSVALVSSGDAGIYGLAALAFELLDRAAKPEWRAVELVVCPGLSALQAAAARAGAPLGHDFCAVSL